MNNKKPYALLEQEFSDLRRLYSSLSSAVKGINAESALLRKENAFLKAQNTNADSNVAIQKKITMDNIMQSKEIENNLVAEIIALKKELKWQTSQSPGVQK